MAILFKRVSAVILLTLTTAWYTRSLAWNAFIALVAAAIAYITVEVMQHQESKKQGQDGNEVAIKRDDPLVILSAYYGMESGWKDVTTVVRGFVREGRLSLVVTNEVMGGDPAPWKVKELKLQYSFHGVTNKIVVKEEQRLQLP